MTPGGPPGRPPAQGRWFGYASPDRSSSGRGPSGDRFRVFWKGVRGVLRGDPRRSMDVANSCGCNLRLSEVRSGSIWGRLGGPTAWGMARLPFPRLRRGAEFSKRANSLYPAVSKDAFNCFLCSPPPGGPEGGSGVLVSFRSRGFGPDPVGGVILSLLFRLTLSKAGFKAIFVPSPRGQGPDGHLPWTVWGFWQISFRPGSWGAVYL